MTTQNNIMAFLETKLFAQREDLGWYIYIWKNLTCINIILKIKFVFVIQLINVLTMCRFGTLVIHVYIVDHSICIDFQNGSWKYYSKQLISILQLMNYQMLNNKIKT